MAQNRWEISSTCYGKLFPPDPHTIPEKQGYPNKISDGSRLKPSRKSELKLEVFAS